MFFFLSLVLVLFNTFAVNEDEDGRIQILLFDHATLNEVLKTCKTNAQ